MNEPIKHGEEDAQHWLNKMHEIIPIESMWDGFWIKDFSKKDLVISCSFDRILYRNFDIIFKDVSFFNLPYEWRDSNLIGQKLFYLEKRNDFEKYSNLKLKDSEFVFGIDLYFSHLNQKNHTFTIVAQHVFTEECRKGDAFPDVYYKDPLGDKGYLSLENRVDLINKK
jgi:hypothetical protein